MALTVWSAGQVLNAAPLNANFAEVAAGKLPGAVCTAGAVTAIVVGNNEVPAGTPPGGQDIGGYWNNTSKRFVIPSGLAGLHFIQASVRLQPGGTKGDLVNLTIVGAANAGEQTIPRSPSFGMPGTITQLAYCGGGTSLHVQCWTEVAGSVQVLEFRIFRMGDWGLY